MYCEGTSMKGYLILTLMAATLFSVATNPTLACTYFKLTAKDGTLLITRSMEFGPDLQSNLEAQLGVGFLQPQLLIISLA